MTITITAFQIGAFQLNGFQEAVPVSGSGGKLWFWYDMIARAKAKRLADEKKKKRKDEEDEEEVEPAVATMRFVLTAPDRMPMPSTLLKLLTRLPLLDELAEVDEFKAMIAFADSLVDGPLYKRVKPMRRVQIATPAHENPTVVRLQDALAPKIAAFLAAQAPKIAHQVEVLRAKFWKADLSPEELLALDHVVAGIDFTGWAALVGDIEPVLAEATKDGAYAAFKAVSFDVSADPEKADIVNEDALAYAEDRAAEMVGMRRGAKGKLVPNPRAKWQITEATRDDIRDLVGDALDEGWSAARLADALTESDAFSAERAMMIARTELIRASNQGTLNGFKTSGVVQQKEWTTFDPCPICEENEDQGPIGIDDDFASGDDAPPAHPNCKCALVGLTELDTQDTQAEEE